MVRILTPCTADSGYTWVCRPQPGDPLVFNLVTPLWWVWLNAAPGVAPAPAAAASAAPASASAAPAAATDKADAAAVPAGVVPPPGGVIDMASAPEWVSPTRPMHPEEKAMLTSIVDELLSGQPDAHAYFARMKSQNRTGPAVLGPRSPLREGTGAGC